MNTDAFSTHDVGIDASVKGGTNRANTVGGGSVSTLALDWTGYGVGFYTQASWCKCGYYS